jgi:hypothetical protein
MTQNKPKNIVRHFNEEVKVKESATYEKKAEEYNVNHKLSAIHILLTTLLSFIGYFFVGGAFIFASYIISILLIFYLPGYKEKIITIEKGEL